MNVICLLSYFLFYFLYYFNFLFCVEVVVWGWACVCVCLLHHGLMSSGSNSNNRRRRQFASSLYFILRSFICQAWSPSSLIGRGRPALRRTQWLQETDATLRTGPRYRVLPCLPRSIFSAWTHEVDTWRAGQTTRALLFFLPPFEHTLFRHKPTINPFYPGWENVWPEQQVLFCSRLLH